VRPGPEVFSHITLASRTKSKCDAIAEDVAKRTGIKVATVRLTRTMFRKVSP